MSLEHIKNFMSVTSKLATAGQPSETQLQEIADAGFDVIINLGLLDPKYCLSDEAGLIQSLGLEYHHIPVNFQTPKIENLHDFFSFMDIAKNKKVFVHCAANKRVSSFIALYGEAKLNWSRKKADTIIEHIWQPDEVWNSFMEQARQKLKLTNQGS